MTNEARTATTRRGLLAGAGAVAAGAALTKLPAQAKAKRRRRLRIAHLTDFHLRPDAGTTRYDTEPYANEAIRAALGHRPDLILQGGDVIYDAQNATKEAVEGQWAVYRRVFGDLRVPVVATLGNHDHWWHPTAAGDPLADTAWALKELKLDKPYYALDAGGWRLIVLHSVRRTGTTTGYTGGLGAEQLAWLDDELGRLPKGKPVFLLTHIPIITAYPMAIKRSVFEDKEFRIGGGTAFLDAHAVKDLFVKHRRAYVTAAGHLHVREDGTYNHVRYLNSGAVSGNWWNKADPGNWETPAGYGIIDLYRDGSVEHAYLSYRQVAPEEIAADN